MRTVVLAALLLAACAPRTPLERGEAAFHDRHFSGSSLNAATCATCHSTDAAAGDAILAGGSLRGVMGRPTYFGGALRDPRDAVNACLYYFMLAPIREPLAVDDPRGEDLLTYLDTLGTESAPPVAFTVPETLPTTLPAGDAMRGAALYRRACLSCHGELHTGAGQLADFVPIIPDDTVTEHGDAARSIAIGKIRQGGFYGIGGQMPPFSIETLDDAAMADVLAYLEL